MIINSNKIGYGAQASGFSSIAFGDNAHANRAKSIAIGPNTAVSGFSGIAIGVNALDVENSSNGGSVVMGTAASSWGGNAGANVIIGSNATSSSGNSIAIGVNATVTAGQGIAIGLGATVNGTNGYGMAFGFNSIVNNDASISFNSIDTGPYQWTMGNAGNPITAMYIGAGVNLDHTITADTATNQLTVSGYGFGHVFVGDKITGPGIPPNTTIIASSGGYSPFTLSKTVDTPETAATFQDVLGIAVINATGAKTGGNNDIGGTDLIVAGGQSVGTGTAGSVRLQTTFAGPTTSNTAINPLVDRFYVNGYQNPLTTATPSNLFQMAVPDLTNAGGSVDYTVFATDGTDVQSLSGTVRFAAVAQAGTITFTTVDDPNFSFIATGGSTLTLAWTGVDLGGNNFALQVTPTESLATTIFNIAYAITNNSAAAIITL